MSKSNGESRELACIDEACRALVDAQSFEPFRKTINAAEALRVCLKKAERGLAAQNEAAILKIKAERMAGMYLAKIPKAKGGRPKKTQSTMLEVSDDELPTQYERYRLELEASVPESQFQTHIAQCKESGKEITSVGVRRLAKQIQGGESKKRVKRNSIKQAAKDDPRTAQEIVDELVYLVALFIEKYPNKSSDLEFELKTLLSFSRQGKT